MRLAVFPVLLAAALASPQGKGATGSGAASYNPGGTPGNRGPNMENELISGDCRDVFFIMARASSEPGNMVCNRILLNKIKKTC
jgi:hypothetical protein